MKSNFGLIFFFYYFLNIAQSPKRLLGSNIEKEVKQLESFWTTITFLTPQITDVIYMLIFPN